MQTSYARDLKKSFAGMSADGVPGYVESLLAKEELGLGLALVKSVGRDKACRLPKVNSVDVAVSADLIADDVLTVTVNGTEVEETYATSHDATMEALATALEALAEVTTAVFDADKTIALAATEGTDLVVTAEVTNGGSGTAVATVAHGTSDTMHAISLHTHQLAQDRETGAVVYPEKAMVNAMRQGRVWVLVEEEVTSDDQVYMRFLADGTTKLPGQFRKSADSAKAILVSGARFVTSAGAGELAVIEINLP